MARERFLALLCCTVALAALGAALGSERWGGLVPCALCLVERWPYRVAAGIAAVAMLLPRRWLLWLIVAAMGASAVVAALHVGVEHGWWPSPLPECAAPSLGGGSIAERLARMPATPSKPCDEATYLIPGLPLSMAALNLVLSLAFASSLAICMARPARSSA